MRVCCYPWEPGFVAAAAAHIRDTAQNLNPGLSYRLLLSAHGLPKPIVDAVFENERMRGLFDMDRIRTIEKEHREKTTYQYHTLAALAQLSAWFETVYDA